jgi:hypothetical protein
LIATLAWLTPAFADGHLATVTVIHGIDGRDLGLDQDLPVDVFVEGVGCALTDFRFGDVSPRLELPEGTYAITVSFSDGACGGDAAIGPLDVPFAGGENSTVIAHLGFDVDDNVIATASKFVNDLSMSEKGEGRVGLHHTAAAPAVDIRLYAIRPFRGWKPALELEGVTNGQAASADLHRGIYIATVAPAHGKPIFYQFLHIEEAITTQVYAVGSVGGGTFTLLLDAQEQVADDAPGGGTAEVTVIHGVNGLDLGASEELPVDVFVDGVGCALTDFHFGDISPRLELPEGTYAITVSFSDGSCGGDAAIGPVDVPFAAGESATVIAHLGFDADENVIATATKYVNDLDRARRGRGRLEIHHNAVAPAVDIAVKRKYRRHPTWRLENVSNPMSAAEDLYRGRYTVSIAPAGGTPIFHERLGLSRYEATRVYAVGSVANGTFQLLVDRQQLDR